MAEAQYSDTVTAKAFAKFAGQAGGEKALLWGRLRRVFLSLATKRAVRCLDFGCGTGWLARQASIEFGARAVGFDPSAKMIAQARRSKSGAVYFDRLEDASDEGPYDLVFAVFVTPALEKKSALTQMFVDVAGMLARDGRVVVAAADPQTVFARHAFYESRAPAKKVAGASYQTDILGPDGGVIVTVTDYYWPSSAVLAAAASAGLRLLSDCRVTDPSASPNPKHFAYRIWEFQRS